MIIVITSQSQSIPSYTFDAGDITNDEAAKIAATIARRHARAIPDAVVDIATQYNVITDQYEYAYNILELNWASHLPHHCARIVTVQIKVQP